MGNSTYLYPVLVATTQHGGLDLRQDGGFVYTPDSNFTGTDSFTYKASDGIADSSPVTVTITVHPRQGIDLDGRDTSSNGQWKGEADESVYGIGVGGSGSAAVLARSPVAPTGSGWQLTSRVVSWNPSILAVGGTTSPGYTSLALTGDQVLSVTAVATGFTSSPITYLETWNNVITGALTNLLVDLPAKEATAQIDKVEFTSDHAVLLNNGNTEGRKVDDLLARVTKDAGRYSDIEWWRGDPAKKRKTYNAPITHTRDSMMTVKAHWSSAGITPGTPYTIEGATWGYSGFAAPPLQITFSSLELTTTGNAEEAVVVANLMTSENIGKWSFSITWTVTLNPGTPAAKTLSLGASEDHVVYQTYGKPRLVGVVGTPKPGSPTVARMEVAVKQFETAYATASVATSPAPPKPARLIYTLAKMHVFNGNGNIVSPNGKEVDDNRCWLVPKYWTEKYPDQNGQVGGNCVSGATFVRYAALMIGLPGTIEYKQYAAKVTDPDVAVEIPTNAAAEGPGRTQGQKDKANYRVALHFAGASDNAFEGTVVYKDTTPGATQFFIPILNGDVLYDSKDKVITIFTTFEWAIKKDGKWVQQDPPDVIKTYTLATSLALSKLDE